MTPETTLEAVRELSEGATLRPAPRRLRLQRATDRKPGRRGNIIAYEELHPPTVRGRGGSAGNNQARQPRATDHCHFCGKRAEYCYCNVSPRRKDLLSAVLEKSEAATERQPVVIPAGHF